MSRPNSNSREEPLHVIPATQIGSVGEFRKQTHIEVTDAIDFSLRPRTSDWLMHSVLQKHISDYYSYLRDRRYAEKTRRAYLGCVVHFAHWMTNEKVQLRALGKPVVERFLSDHLPHCDCSRPGRRTPQDNRAALMHLVKVLQASGALEMPRNRRNHVETELAGFDRHMDRTLGLAWNTRKQRIQIIRRFLTERFGSTAIIPAALKTTDVREFILNRMASWSAGSKQVIGGALRCYLRFRSAAGDDMRTLLAAIPLTANWRLATLPEVLSEAEIKQLLRSFDQPFPSAKRAYAIVRCLVDLGLRSSEVIRLQLDNIDWSAGTVRLAATKSRRVDILPLPPETGRAIADYLVTERPRTGSRAVFVRHTTPFDQPIKSGVVERVVRKAYRRCGWTRTRVHILRHSMASRLLQVDTPLKEIADILRHRSLDTSAIYTKVDVNRLTAVALPWPGSMS